MQSVAEEVGNRVRADLDALDLHADGAGLAAALLLGEDALGLRAVHHLEVVAVERGLQELPIRVRTAPTARYRHLQLEERTLGHVSLAMQLPCSRPAKPHTL